MEKMEKFIMMIINALGMLEKRYIDISKRITRMEDWSREVTEAFNSYNTCLEDITIQISQKQQSFGSVIKNKDIKVESAVIQKSQTINQQKTTSDAKNNISSTTAPEEDEILAFRSKLLKPIPKEESSKSKEPTSIRTALLQEMKDFFKGDSKENE